MEVKKIVSKDPDVIGISIGHTTFQYSIKLMKIEKRIFFERLGIDKKVLLKLFFPDYFDKKKKEHKYEDFFRKALRGTKCGC